MSATLDDVLSQLDNVNEELRYIAKKVVFLTYRYDKHDDYKNKE